MCDNTGEFQINNGLLILATQQSCCSFVIPYTGEMDPVGLNTFPHFTIHNHMESLTHRNFSFLQIPFLHLFKLVKGRKKKIPILLKFNFGRRQGMDSHLCIDSGWCVIKRNKLSIPLHKIDQVQSRINYLSGESQVVSINNRLSLI